MKTIIVVALVFLSYCAGGQGLSLEDIFAIRKMDSTELRTFSRVKRFNLEEIDIDNWRSVHRYYSSSDSTIWFERTFPSGRKTTRDNRMVYYHFADTIAHEEFKVRMKEKGFKFKRTVNKDMGSNKFVHNIYLKGNNEIDLASQELPRQKIMYTLMYYSRMN